MDLANFGGQGERLLSDGSPPSSCLSRSRVAKDNFVAHKVPWDNLPVDRAEAVNGTLPLFISTVMLYDTAVLTNGTLDAVQSLYHALSQEVVGDQGVFALYWRYVARRFAPLEPPLFDYNQAEPFSKHDYTLLKGPECLDWKKLKQPI